MQKRVLSFCLFAAAVLSVGAPVKMIIKGLETVHTSTSPVVKISPVVAQRPGETFVFDTQRTFSQTDNSVHLQGFVKIRGKKYPASATKVKNRFIINHPSRIKNRRQRMNTITLSADGLGHVKSIPGTLMENTACGAKHEEHVHSHQVLPLKEGLPQNTAMFATIHTYADAQFYAKYGTLTNSQMLAYLNTVESIYGTQLGVRFTVVGQTILSQQEEELDAGRILSNFRNDSATQNNNVDLKHLFTAKDMTGSTVGIAYVGALCYSPSYSYGVSQEYYNLTSLILAHELGHNFGASHSASYGTIMYPSISPYAEGFSQDSINLINSHLNYFGSCLEFGEYGPDLTKSVLTISRRNKTISGKLLDKFGMPLSNQKLIVTVNGRLFEKTTNVNGTYRHGIKLKRVKQKFVVFVSTANGEKVSRRLKFKA